MEVVLWGGQCQEQQDWQGLDTEHSLLPVPGSGREPCRTQTPLEPRLHHRLLLLFFQVTKQLLLK